MLLAESVQRRVRENDPALTTLLLAGDAVPRDARGVKALAMLLAVNTAITCLRVQSDSDDLLALLAEVLSKNTTIEDLVVESNALCDSVCMALAQALAANMTLRRLHLDCLLSGMLTDAAGVAVAVALGTNSTLRALHIQGTSCAIGDVTGISMAQALTRNHSLRSLRLAGQRLGDTAGIAISAALKVNRTLEHVFFAGRNIGNTAGFATAMADTLRANITLKSLAIENHHMSDGAGATLGGCLQVNGVLETLRVVCAGIGSETVLALASGLRENFKLKELHVDGLNIREDAVVAMAQAVEVNGTLLHLSLLNPCLHVGAGHEVGDAVSRALRANTTLRSLKLSFGALGEETCVRIAQGLKANASLHLLQLHGYGVGPEDLVAMSSALETNVMLKHLLLDTGSPWGGILEVAEDTSDAEDGQTWSSPDPSTRLHPAAQEEEGSLAATAEASARIAAALERNRMLPEYWRLLVWLTQKTTSPRALRTVAAMTEQGFRRAVFAFFLPADAALPRTQALRNRAQ